MLYQIILKPFKNGNSNIKIIIYKKIKRVAMNKLYNIQEKIINEIREFLKINL